jgi:hypothetical protein
MMCGPLSELNRARANCSTAFRAHTVHRVHHITDESGHRLFRRVLIDSTAPAMAWFLNKVSSSSDTTRFDDAHDQHVASLAPIANQLTHAHTMSRMLNLIGVLLVTVAACNAVSEFGLWRWTDVD